MWKEVGDGTGADMGMLMIVVGQGMVDLVFDPWYRGRNGMGNLRRARGSRA